MTKLKKKFMVNHDGENWVVLDDFMALKRKLKKTQKEYAKARNQLKEANELLKAYGTESLWESLSLSCDEANEYCKKWGVK